MSPSGHSASLDADRPKLRGGALTMTETLGQSIANIAPTFTPALNIAVVAGLAGVGSWISYLIATIGLLFVGASIGTLAQRHPLSGSYFVYIGRTLGPLAGMLAGWAMICAYLFAAVAVALAMSIFLGDFLTAFGLGVYMPPSWMVTIALSAIVLAAAYRDIKLSSRIGLVLEGISIAIIVGIIAIVVARRGTVIDPVQFSDKVQFGGVMSSLAFAVFSFVGFESAATLAKETRNPGRAIPVAILVSAGAVGIFFTVMAYFMVLGAARSRRHAGQFGVAVRRHDRGRGPAMGGRDRVFRCADQRLRVRARLRQRRLAHDLLDGPLPLHPRRPRPRA